MFDQETVAQSQRSVWALLSFTTSFGAVKHLACTSQSICRIELLFNCNLGGKRCRWLKLPSNNTGLVVDAISIRTKSNPTGYGSDWATLFFVVLRYHQLSCLQGPFQWVSIMNYMSTFTGETKGKAPSPRQKAPTASSTLLCPAKVFLEWNTRITNMKHTVSFSFGYTEVIRRCCTPAKHPQWSPPKAKQKRSPQ